VVSKRTVDAQLAVAYRKLDVHDRKGLAAALFMPSADGHLGSSKLSSARRSSPAQPVADRIAPSGARDSEATRGGGRGETMTTQGPGEGAGEALQSLLASEVVSVEERVSTGRDLVAAGVVSGRWLELERDLLAGLAETRNERASSEDLSRALRDFRYDRWLISADEFSSWLRSRGLQVSQVKAVLERRLARSRDAVAVPPSDLQADLGTALEALPAEAICTGAFAECARWLVDRLLAWSAAGSEMTAPEALVHELAERDRALLATSGLAEPDDERSRRIAWLVSADAAYRDHVEALCSKAAIAAHIRRRQIDWLAFELAGLACAQEHVAAEATMLLREDRVPLEQVARLSGLPVEHRRLLHGEASERLKGWLSTATVGAVVGPVPEEGSHWVWVVKHRRAPESSDPEVHARARSEIIEADLARRRAGRVKWHGRS
jgi:hypothetical protein